MPAKRKGSTESDKTNMKRKKVASAKSCNGQSSKNHSSAKNKKSGADHSPAKKMATVLRNETKKDTAPKKATRTPPREPSDIFDSVMKCSVYSSRKKEVSPADRPEQEKGPLTIDDFEISPVAEDFHDASETGEAEFDTTAFTLTLRQELYGTMAMYGMFRTPTGVNGESLKHPKLHEELHFFEYTRTRAKTAPKIMGHPQSVSPEYFVDHSDVRRWHKAISDEITDRIFSYLRPLIARLDLLKDSSPPPTDLNSVFEKLEHEPFTNPIQCPVPHEVQGYADAIFKAESEASEIPGLLQLCNMYYKVGGKPRQEKPTQKPSFNYSREIGELQASHRDHQKSYERCLEQFKMERETLAKLEDKKKGMKNPSKSWTENFEKFFRQTKQNAEKKWQPLKKFFSIDTDWRTCFLPPALSFEGFVIAILPSYVLDCLNLQGYVLGTLIPILQAYLQYERENLFRSLQYERENLFKLEIRRLKAEKETLELKEKDTIELERRRIARAILTSGPPPMEEMRIEEDRKTRSPIREVLTKPRNAAPTSLQRPPSAADPRLEAAFEKMPTFGTAQTSSSSSSKAQPASTLAAASCKTRPSTSSWGNPPARFPVESQPSLPAQPSLPVCDVETCLQDGMSPAKQASESGQNASQDNAWYQEDTFDWAVYKKFFSGTASERKALLATIKN